MAISKSKITDKTQFTNELINLSDEEKEFWAQQEQIASQYQLFSNMNKKQRKEKEIECVIAWKEAIKNNNKELANKYFLELFYGNFPFIKAKIFKVFRKRRNDIITTMDLFGAAVLALITALRKYKPDHESNARFLNYYEKFLEGALLQYADTENVFSLSLEYLEEVQERDHKEVIEDSKEQDTRDGDNILVFSQDKEKLNDLIVDIIDLIYYIERGEYDKIDTVYPLMQLLFIIRNNKEKIIKELSKILWR
ncbi:MAG: hypothetical protein QXI58_00380 [Candidatus Micrarchaeia archaeon]